MQLVVFGVLFLVFAQPVIGRRLVPRRLQRAEAHRAAMEQFMIRGMARKANRAGVLIFVSQAERYARIVADDGVAHRVDQKAWQDAIEALLAQVRQGHLAEGLIAAIGQCGAVLATHFPPTGGADELPDRVYLI